MGSMVLRMLASKPLTDYVDECAKAGIGVISGQRVSEMACTSRNPSGRSTAFEANGQMRPAFSPGRLRRVRTRLPGPTERFRPRHQDAFGSFEMLFDVTPQLVPPPICASHQTLKPSASTSNERLQAGAVLGLVPDQNIRR